MTLESTGSVTLLTSTANSVALLPLEGSTEAFMARATVAQRFVAGPAPVVPRESFDCDFEAERRPRVEPGGDDLVADQFAFCANAASPVSTRYKQETLCEEPQTLPVEHLLALGDAIRFLRSLVTGGIWRSIAAQRIRLQLPSCDAYLRTPLYSRISTLSASWWISHSHVQVCVTVADVCCSHVDCNTLFRRRHNVRCALPRGDMHVYR